MEGNMVPQQSTLPQKFVCSCGGRALTSATRANLYMKRVQLNPSCAVCNHQSETVEHILWECPFAHNVWAMVRGKIQKSSAVAPDFFPLTRQMMQRLPRPKMEHWAMIAWAIWNARNKCCFEDTQTRPEVILRGATSFLHEYQALIANQQTCMTVTTQPLIVFYTIFLWQLNFGLYFTHFFAFGIGSMSLSLCPGYCVDLHGSGPFLHLLYFVHLNILFYLVSVKKNTY